MRIFPASSLARLAFQVRAHQSDSGSVPLEIDVVSGDGSRAVAISLNVRDGQITAWNGETLQSVEPYSIARWVNVEMSIDCSSQRYDLKVDGKLALSDAAFLERTARVERVVFRTGVFRLRDFRRRPHVDGTWLTDRIPNADVLQPTSRFDLDNIILESQASRKQ